MLFLWFSEVTCFVTSFFPPRATLMSVLQEYRYIFSVFIPLMAYTYERIIFLPSLLVFAAILLFLLLPASSCNSRWPSSLHLLVVTLSPTDVIKRTQLFTVTVTCNDRYQRLQFVHAIVICYVINFQQLELMLPVMWKQDYVLIFKSRLLKNIKSVEVYSFPFRKKNREQNWLVFLKTD